MGNAPALSIITPVRQGEDFIEECLKNVIGQRCSQAEHIIVDGGSSDTTMEIVRTYAEKYPHIRWISEKDAGQSDAMNKGILLAQGAIISFLNDDDYYEPNVLNHVLKIFEECPEPTLLVGNCNIWGDKGELLTVNKPTRLDVTDFLAWFPQPANPSAYFYHKSLHDRIGFYAVDQHYLLDTLFLLDAVRHAHVRYIDETWGNFRMIQGTKTHYANLITKQAMPRKRRLFRAYCKKLPLWQRYKVHWKHIRYYRRDPFIRRVFAYAKRDGTSLWQAIRMVRNESWQQ